MWQCQECRRERAWGEGKPETPKRLVMIRCEGCERLTSHEYLYLDTYSREFFDLLEAV
jgi:hypothetical protein